MGAGKMNERSFIVKYGHFGGKTRRLPVAPIFFDSTHRLKAARLPRCSQDVINFSPVAAICDRRFFVGHWALGVER
jgi:hypothetical protein